MKASELRIENLLRDKVTKTELKVIELTEKDIVTRVIDRSKFPLKDGWGIEPMPLTEEWLLKLGFEKYKYGHNTYRQKSFIIEEGLLKNSPYEFRKRISKEDSLGLAYVKYVHQLQNLYFALTGEELAFKSE